MSVIPRVYIACLAAYNNGELHGVWIDLDGTESIEGAIASMLTSSPQPDAEEWAIHDYEFCGHLGEYEGIDRLQAIQEAFEACQDNSSQWEPFIEYCGHKGDPIAAELWSSFEEDFAGSASSFLDWCEEFIDSTGLLNQMPESLRRYFNTEAYARDMEINDVFTIEHNNEVFVFWHS